MFYAILVAIFLLAGVILTIFNHKRRREDLTVWRDLVPACGLNITREPAGFPYRPIQAAGTVRGMRIEMGERLKYSNSSFIRTEVPLPSRFLFEISTESGFSKSGWNIGFAKKAGILTDINTGDAQFDKIYYLKSSDPDRLKILLNAEIRSKLLKLAQLTRAESLPGVFVNVWPRFLLDEKSLTYCETQFIRMDGNAAERFKLAMEIVVDMGLSLPAVC